jgi:hypothetical protein
MQRVRDEARKAETECGWGKSMSIAEITPAYAEHLRNGWVRNVL